MTELAKAIKILTQSPKKAQLLYDISDTVEEKIEKIAAYYGAAKVEYTEKALKDLELIHKFGLSDIPVCVAKTQYSLSCNSKALGRPEGFTVKVRRLVISSGAGFIVAVTGSILRMPGLPKEPAASSIDIDEDREIIGLF
jgi:formate--tetrahydrofolate ligase